MNKWMDIDKRIDELSKPKIIRTNQLPDIKAASPNTLYILNNLQGNIERYMIIDGEWVNIDNVFNKYMNPTIIASGGRGDYIQQSGGGGNGKYSTYCGGGGGGNGYPGLGYLVESDNKNKKCYYDISPIPSKGYIDKKLEEAQKDIEKRLGRKVNSMRCRRCGKTLDPNDIHVLVDHNNSDRRVPVNTIVMTRVDSEADFTMPNKMYARPFIPGVICNDCLGSLCTWMNQMGEWNKDDEDINDKLYDEDTINKFGHLINNK